MNVYEADPVDLRRRAQRHRRCTCYILIGAMVPFSAGTALYIVLFETVFIARYIIWPLWAIAGILVLYAIFRAYRNYRKTVQMLPQHYGQDIQEFAVLKRLCHKFKFKKTFVDRCFVEFASVDQDSSGSISLDEFLSAFRLDSTFFTRRTFTLFDTDNSGHLDFNEFIAVIYNYCTATDLQLIQYIFGLFSQSSHLTLSQFDDLMQFVWGKRLDDRVEMVLEHIDEMMHKQQTTVLQVQHPSVSSSTPPSPGLENEQRSEISLARLVEWQSLFPILLFPATMLQEHMRARVFGAKFWIDEATKIQEKFLPHASLSHRSHRSHRSIGNQDLNSGGGEVSSPFMLQILMELLGQDPTHRHSPVETAGKNKRQDSNQRVDRVAVKREALHRTQHEHDVRSGKRLHTAHDGFGFALDADLEGAVKMRYEKAWLTTMRNLKAANTPAMARGTAQVHDAGLSGPRQNMADIRNKSSSLSRKKHVVPNQHHDLAASSSTSTSSSPGKQNYVISSSKHSNSKVHPVQRGFHGNRVVGKTTTRPTGRAHARCSAK